MTRRGPARHRCVHCNARMDDLRRQPHCLTEECNRGYAEHMALTQVRREGECEVWTGKVNTAKTAIVVVTVARGSKHPPYKEYRALDLRYELAGREKGTWRRYTRTCGTPRCVSVEHNQIDRAENIEPAGLTGHLDPAPLQRRLERTEREVPSSVRKYMNEALQRGWVSVGKVDEICCDFLRIHPIELYGEEFYTA